jgi:hypothetical protein
MLQNFFDWIKQRLSAPAAMTQQSARPPAPHEILLRDLSQTPHRPEIDKLMTQQIRQRSTLARHKIWLRLQTRLDEKFAAPAVEDDDAR